MALSSASALKLSHVDSSLSTSAGPSPPSSPSEIADMETGRTSLLKPLSEESGFTLPQVAFTAFKAVVGPGVLYNPHVFALGGYAVGGVALTSTYLLWAAGVHSLLRLNLTNGGDNSYEELAVLAMGSFGKRLVEIAVALQQLGITLSYFVFVATTAEAAGLSMPSWLIIMGMALLEMPLAVLQNLERLRPSILFATGLCAAALCWTLGHIFWELSEVGINPGCVIVNPASWGVALGGCVYAFEGSAALALPVQKATRPSLRKSAANVYVGTVAGIACLYCVLGTAGYLLYGPEVQTVIVDSLPHTWPTQIARVCFAVMVFLSYPFQLFPASGILSRWMLQQRADNVCLGTLLRVTVVLGCAVVGYLLRGSLDHLTALIGSCLGIPLSFVLPAVIHWRAAPQSLASRLMHAVTISLGVSAMFFTMYINITTW